MSWLSPSSCIHLEDKSHYWCQRGYFHSVSHLPLSLAAIKGFLIRYAFIKEIYYDYAARRSSVPSVVASPLGWHFVLAQTAER